MLLFSRQFGRPQAEQTTLIFCPATERKRLVLTQYVGGHFRRSSAPVAKYPLGVPGRPCHLPLLPFFFSRFPRNVQNKSSLLKPLSPKDDVSTWAKFLLDVFFLSRLHFFNLPVRFSTPCHHHYWSPLNRRLESCCESCRCWNDFIRAGLNEIHTLAPRRKHRRNRKKVQK